MCDSPFVHALRYGQLIRSDRTLDGDKLPNMQRSSGEESSSEDKGLGETAKEPLKEFADVCPRVQAWVDSHSQARYVSQASRQVELSADWLQRKPGRRILFWIDSADVECMREVVELCQRLHGTIHVGHSTGALVAKRVAISEGWLGTTLSEVSEHAELVITLGSSLLSDSPLVAERFFRRKSSALPIRWLHIGEQPLHGNAPLGSIDAAVARLPDQQHVWRRQHWLGQLTQLLMRLRSVDKLPGSADAVDAECETAPIAAADGDCASRCIDDPQGSLIALAQQLVQSRNSVWLWQNSEFSSEMDELLVSRLHSIARELTTVSRCSLLNLESSPGRLTAEECLLWLTGCSGNATWDGFAWQQNPRFPFLLLDEWRREFDHIVLIRSAAVVEPLPNLRADVVVAGASKDASVASGVSAYVAVDEVGADERGYLVRGDRGGILPAGPSGSSSVYTAADWLRDAIRRFDGLHPSHGMELHAQSQLEQ